ncbi:MAG: patatin family protein [Clostridia bacterium]|nr:patatin family protein [Clostridia bacterium]
MKHKPYSKLNELPQKTASDIITEGCLVLEGGAFRGLYTQGFLDCMMENDINLRCTVGVSAGALAGMNYVSGQIGRSARINLTYRHDSRYVGAKAFFHSRSILDVGFLTEERGIFYELDKERFFDPAKRLVAVATSCESGKEEYFEKGSCSDIVAAIKASATMPFISPAVMIDGKPYMDGGCACKIPYRFALENGFEKILVIRTRESGFRKPEKYNKAAHIVYHRYPAFAESLAVSNQSYNAQCDEIEKLHHDGRLLRIAPKQHVEVSRVESDLEKLGALYHEGYDECLEMLPTIRAYLGI